MRIKLPPTASVWTRLIQAGFVAEKTSSGRDAIEAKQQPPHWMGRFYGFLGSSGSRGSEIIRRGELYNAALLSGGMLWDCYVSVPPPIVIYCSSSQY